MKIFARRIEAPTPDKPYATKWQIAVGESGDDPQALQYFDEINIFGTSVVKIDEARNPAVWIEIPFTTTSVIGLRDGQLDVVLQ